MIFPPIIQREWRLQARRKSTYRIRWCAGLIASLAFFIALRFVPIVPGSFTLGVPLFLALASAALVLCIGAGVFLTSDCLSEEKREGTLGLLFLSGLTGYEVVLGKFIALSLNAVYGLLAFLPLTATPVLLGGVTLADVARMALALLNTLFLSLAGGLCVSAFVRKSSWAIGLTLGGLLILVAALPAAAVLVSLTGLSPYWACLTWLSPAYAFGSALQTAYVAWPARFWGSLAASHLVAWLLLAVASRAAESRWQTESLPDTTRPSGWTAQRRRRRPRLGTDPVRWLLGDGPVLRGVVWSLVAAWAALVASGWVWSTLRLPIFPTTIVCAFGLKTLIAFQACRFFGEARQSGALELLLATPLRNSDLILAQWRTLRRIFLWPLLVFLGLCFAAESLREAALLPGPGPAPPWGNSLGRTSPLPQVGYLVLSLAADTGAVGWFGMWLALKMKRANLATVATIFCVLLVPALVSWLSLVADMLFISYATTKFAEDLRHFLHRF